MRLILVTSDKQVVSELDCINNMLERGLKKLHIRKPGLSKQGLEEFIKCISTQFHKNLVIHSHYELAVELNLGGIHLPENIRKEDRANWVEFKKKGFSVSTSIHKLEVLSEVKAFDYNFLGPVFSSITKKEYGPIYLPEQFKQELKQTSQCVIGIGGVTENNIGEISRMGFSGAAVLGAVWESKNPVTAFENIRNTMLENN